MKANVLELKSGHTGSLFSPDQLFLLLPPLCLPERPSGAPKARRCALCLTEHVIKISKFGALHVQAAKCSQVRLFSSVPTLDLCVCLCVCVCGCVCVCLCVYVCVCVCVCVCVTTAIAEAIIYICCHRVGRDIYILSRWPFEGLQDRIYAVQNKCAGTRSMKRSFSLSELHESLDDGIAPSTMRRVK